MKRIEKEGGTIIDDRLGGILAVSRGLGDFDLKSKGLTCEPHITKKLIDHNINYCVLASDGVWDVLSPDEVAKITQTHTDAEHMGFDSEYKFEKVNDSILLQLFPYILILFVLFLAYLAYRRLRRY